MTRWLKPAAAIFLVLYMLIQVLSFRLHEKKELSAMERFILFLAVPMQSFFWNGVDGSFSFWGNYIALTQTSKLNAQLQKQIQNLNGELSKAEEAVNENARLRALLELPEKEKIKMIVAERIASGASPFERTIRVRKGQAENVQREMGVIHPLGVVGQVMQTSEHSSDILLIIDLNSAVDSMSQRSRARGIIRGSGMQDLTFDYLSKNDDLQVGDEIITTGFDGIFPKEIPVGIVTKLVKDTKGLFYSAQVKPNVDFNRLEEVAIVERGLEKP